MKKKITFLITAAVMLLTMMASTATAWGQAPVNTKLWEETWTGGTAGETPSAYGFEGTTVYGNATLTYAQSSTNTKLYEDVLAGGTSPELLLSKSDQTWTISNIPTGQAVKMSLTYLSNKTTFTVTSSTTGISISGSQKSWTINATSSVSSFDLTIKNTGSQNARIDNIVLIVTEAGTPTGNPTINADNVSIDYNATLGSIEYTITDGVEGGVLSASTTETWLDLGSVGSASIPFTCSANTELANRTATVTLTYTYNTNQTVTKNVTVTQAGSPYAPGGQLNPYTVAQAITAIDAGTGTQGVYATGIISEIVTEYNSQYHNISFNMVDESGDEVFLQAYRCGGDEAANVTVGYIAVVYGNLTYYSSTSLYEFGSGCQIVSLTPPPTPYITANDVEIAYDATFGEIEFTINNPVAGGHLEQPTTEAGWLDFGNIEDNIINFTCEANDGTQRVAQVVLTYLYGTESVSKEITVTQAGNPDVVDHIEDITEAGEYTIQGTIVAKSTRGFVLGDGTGYIYYYKGSEPTQSVGDIVRIVGEVSAPTNYKVFQYTSSATITTATSSEYVPIEPVPTSGADMDGTVTGTGVYQTDYVQYAGTLTVNDTHYNITSIDGATTAIGSISYPTNTDFTSLDGKQVTVTGYYVGVSSNKYFNTMLGSIEEVVGEPSITLAQYTYDINADGGNNELPVTYTNMPANPHAEVVFYDATGTTATTYGWITATINTNNNIDGNIAVNEGEARSAYFKVKGIDADNNAVYSDLVTINQAAAAAGPSIVFTTTSIDIIAGGENRTMSFDYEGLGTSPTFSVNFYTATGEPATYDWIIAEVQTGDNKVDVTVDPNTGDARTAYFKVYGANGDVNTESNLVTVNQAAGSTPTPGNWVLTDLADLTASDVFVIVGTYTVDNSSYAMSNDNGTANPPAAVEVTVSGNTLSGDIAANIQWNISGNGTDGYTFYPNGDATTWLYITSSNAKCSVGTNASKTFVLDAETGYLKHVGTSKYIGIYNSTDWRGYNPLHANIAGETFAFYKKVDGPATPSITASDITNISYTTQGVSSPVTVNNYVDGGQLGGFSESDWIEDISAPGEGSSYTLTFNVTENTTGAARTATLTLTYFYYDEVANDYAEVSTDISVTQAAAPQYYSLTVEPYENLEIITFVDEEMVLEGDGTVQVASGAQVMLYIVAEEGYVIETLMVNGVDHKADIDEENHYSFVMPGENVAISATAVEYIPPVGGDYVRITSSDQLTDGSKVVIAARYDDEHTDGYYAMPNQTSGKPTGVQFTSSASGDDEILPATIVVDEDDYYWTVNETEHGYTFTNANGDMIGYSSSTNFATGGANTEWSIELSTSEGTAMVGEYTGFVIKNYNTNTRAFAFNGSVFGAYATSNMAGSGYNFYLDFFVQGSTPITTPTITVDPDLVEAPAAGEDSSLGLEYENLEITSAEDFGIQFYDEDENELNGDDEPDWLVVVVEGTGFYEVNYIVNENDGNARTAYFKVFAMGDSDWVYSNLVTVTQEAASATALYSYSVNGDEGDTFEATVGETITLAIGNNLNDYFTFAGWTTNPNNVNEQLTGDFTLNEEVTVFYAVYAHTTGNAKNAKDGASYVKVTNSSDLTDGNYLIVYEGEGSSLAFDGSRDKTEEPKLDAANNTISVTISGGAIASSTTTDASIFTINVIEGGYSIQSASGYYIGQTGDANGMAVNTTAYTNTITFDEGNADIVSGGAYMRYNKSSGQERFRYYKSSTYTGQQPIQLYKYTNGGGGTTTAYYTRVFLEDPAGNVTIAGPSIIPDGTTLTASITNSLGAGSLIIEDGAQLIHNDAVNATLQKNITGYGTDPNAADGWYLISSPVANLSTSAVTIDTYDLFAYEEAAAYWWSNTGSNSFDALQQGIGYLYANSANQTLNFAGTMVGTNTAVEKAMTAECTYDNLKGYNLMGNPFTCNLENGDIKIGATAITSVLVAEGGDDYVTVNLNDDGAVKPGQGFMVQTAAPATLTLNPGSSKGANSGFVRIVAGNENSTDRAYINVANGNTLRKISLSDDNTQVYVMNDDKDYAAARVDELIGSMPVHFKAAEDGEYTITIEAVNTDTEYMHLIDNFTGDDIDLLLESSYTFNATTNDSEARFRLDFGTYGVNEIAENNTFAYQYGNEIVVSGEGDLQIFDVMGRMVKNTKVNGVERINVPANAVYIFKLDEKVQKIVVR